MHVYSWRLPHSVGVHQIYGGTFTVLQYLDDWQICAPPQAQETQDKTESGLNLEKRPVFLVWPRIQPT